MVHQMEEDNSNPSSPVGDSKSPPTEWLMTNTVDNKQFFSNDLTTKGENTNGMYTRVASTQNLSTIT